MYPRAVAQSSQKCPMCGASMTPGVMVCPSCGEDLTKASMVVSTSVQPLSRNLQRKVASGSIAASGSKALYLVLAVVVAATVIVGLGYVPVVSARVPQLGALSSTVEDAVGRAMQWGREMMGPDKKAPAPTPVPVMTIPAAPPSPAKPAPVTPEPVTQQPAPKPAQATPGPPAKKPVAKPRPARPAQQVTPTVSSPAKPLKIGARAPQFVIKDLRGVLYRMPNARGRRVAVLFVSALDASGRAAIHRFISRFGDLPEYDAMVVVNDEHTERTEVRRLVASGIRVPILIGNARIASIYRVPKDGGVLYVISEVGVIEQARVFHGKQ